MVGSRSEVASFVHAAVDSVSPRGRAAEPDSDLTLTRTLQVGDSERKLQVANRIPAGEEPCGSWEILQQISRQVLMDGNLDVLTFSFMC